jgi:hypothetical protein
MQGNPGFKRSGGGGGYQRTYQRVKLMNGKIEDLHEIWSTLDVCYEHHDK